MPWMRLASVRPDRDRIRERNPIPVRLQQEETILSLGFHDGGALVVVVRHVVDPRAYGIAPHKPGIKGRQQFGRRSHIRRPRIEPECIGIWIENDWHTVVDGRCHGIRHGRKD